MAVINFFGFESGDAMDLGGSSGTFSIQSTTKRTGTYALRSNPATTGVGYVAVQGVNNAGQQANLANSVPDGGAASFFKFHFNYATKPASGYEYFALVTIAGSATQKVALAINSDGTLGAYDTSGTLIANGTTVLSPNTWYRINFVSRNSASGEFTLKIDGTDEITSSTVNFGATNNGTLRLGKAVDNNGNSVDFFYDDVKIDTAAHPDNSTVKIMIPIAAGTYQTFTPSTGTNHWEVVDEIPPNTTDYLISTGVASDAETNDLQTASQAGVTGTPNAVKAIVNRIRHTATNGSMILRVRSASTNSDTTTLATTNSVSDQQKVLATDPATAAAWTLSGIDTLEVGAVEQNANASRLLATYIMVDYTVAPGSFSQTLTDQLVLVDSVLKSTSRTIVDAITFVDTALKNTARTLSDPIVLVDTLTALKAIFKELLEAITLDGSIVRSVSRTIENSLTLADTVNKSISRAIEDAIALVDTVTKSAGKVLTDTLTLADSILRSIGKTLVDEIPLVDTVVKSIGRTIDDAVTLVDSIVKSIGRTLSEALLLDDIVTAVRASGQAAVSIGMFVVHSVYGAASSVKNGLKRLTLYQKGRRFTISTD